MLGLYLGWGRNAWTVGREPWIVALAELAGLGVQGARERASGVGFVRSHPGRKNKDPARVGHPYFVGGWGRLTAEFAAGLERRRDEWIG